MGGESGWDMGGGFEDVPTGTLLTGRGALRNARSSYGQSKEIPISGWVFRVVQRKSIAMAMAELSSALSRSRLSLCASLPSLPSTRPWATAGAGASGDALFPREVCPESVRFAPGRARRQRRHPSVTSALLELVPAHVCKKDLNYELLRFDTVKRKAVDLVVVGAGPAGLAVAQRVSKEGVTVCVVDPAPQSVWPNNYGVWVDEFEDLGLLDCLDYTWASAVVYLDDAREKTLERPYGRVNRTRLKSKMLESCIANGVQFHQSKVSSSSPLFFPL